ncbi:MAG TPA: tetratricopeptide repeat protein, partial [Trichocoleus sp.]
TSLNNLAELHSVQGHYRKAEKLYLQSLEMTKRTLGQDHPTYAVCLSNLAILYARQSRFGKATALLEQALTKQLRTLGQSHPETERTRQSLVNIKAAMH